MKNKKLFSILTLVCFMFTLMPVAAFADNVAEPAVMETGLPDAVNGVITLTEDVTLLDTITIDNGQEITLDLNGHTLTIAASYEKEDGNKTGKDGFVVTDGATLNLTNSSSDEATYKFISPFNGSYDAIYIENGTESNPSELNITGKVKLDVDIDANSAIHTNGDAVINISDGTNIEMKGNVTHRVGAIQLYSNAVLNMYGGSVNIYASFDENYDSWDRDAVGIVVWEPNTRVNLKGGKFKHGGQNAFAQGVQFGFASQDTGNSVFLIDGATFEIYNEGEVGECYPFSFFDPNGGTVKVQNGNISGGPFDSMVTTYYSGTPDIQISGGTFTIDPTDYVYVDEGYKVVEETEDVWMVGQALSSTPTTTDGTVEVTGIYEKSDGNNNIYTVNAKTSTEDENADLSTSVTLAPETAESMALAGAALEIEADAATVVLDNTAMNVVATAMAETKHNVEILIKEKTVEVNDENGNQAVVAVDVTVLVNGKEVLSEKMLDGVKVKPNITITVQTSLTAGSTAYVYYVTDSGLTEEPIATPTVDENGKVTFTVNHLSTYAIFGAPVASETPKEDTTTSGSSSGFSGSYNYPVNIGDVDGAKVTFSDNNAVAGETVTITVTPDSGKQVDEVIVTDADGDVITVTKVGDNKYSFVMPAGKVNVAVTTETIDYDIKVVLQINNKNVIVNGRTIMNDVAPVIQGDRTLVPIRVIVEALGGTADWNEATRTVTITIDGKVLTLVIDEMIPGFGQGAIIMDSRTYVPIRYVAEYIGANVEWIEATQQIVILK